MPFLDVKVSCGLTQEKEKLIASQLGKAIELIPGKKEEHLMLCLTGNAKLWFQGNRDGETAFVEAMVKGSFSKEDYQEFSKQTIKILESELGISGERIYIKCSEAENWFRG